jgi:AAA+ ATPase superfamily predicted ATPase
MSQFPSYLEQFRSFCFQNEPKNIEQAIEYFSVFGGMGWRVNMQDPLELIIKEKLLNNYRYIHGDITKITQSNNIHHSLLTKLATGDRREHSAFKNARVSRNEGEESIDFLVDNDLLDREKSQDKPMNKDEEVSDKLIFTLPFMRFWFASISPYYKGIKEGEFDEFEKNYLNTQQNFSDFIYERLILALIKKNFQEDRLTNIGSYWDKKTDIDILGKTQSGKIVVGTFKLSKSKAKKSELTKLKEKCATAQINADIFIVFF